MTDREDRLRSLLDRVRAKRPGERETHAAEAVDRMRTASGTTAAARQSSVPSPAQPTPFPSTLPTQLPSTPLSDPPTSPTLDSPTQYSSQPPEVERPLSAQPQARSVRPSSAPRTFEPPARSVPPATPAPSSAPESGRPQPIRAQSVAPTGQPVVYATDQPEFPRAKTFGELLELTLSLRPR
jgi:hypothetical protein